jgi:lipoate-protein ligase B
MRYVCNVHCALQSVQCIVPCGIVGLGGVRLTCESVCAKNCETVMCGIALPYDALTSFLHKRQVSVPLSLLSDFLLK